MNIPSEEQAADILRDSLERTSPVRQKLDAQCRAINERTAHTPGPWTHRAGNNTTNDYVKGPDGELIAMVYAPYPSANARLIAAIPDLLEALQSILHHSHWGRVKDGNELEDIYQLAAAALAKVSA